MKIPPEYLDLAAEKTLAPAEIEEAFIKVNPGLSASAISVVCGRKRLSEVRICMSKDLQFRACEETDRRACRRDEVVMPPMRGTWPYPRRSTRPGRIPRVDCCRHRIPE